MTKIILKSKSSNETYSFHHPHGRIGEGALAYVYKGESSKGLPVAVKVLKRETTSNGHVTKIFEDSSLINVQNDHLMKVYDYIVTDAETTKPKFHLIMEYIDGSSFDKVLSGPIELDKAIEFTIQLCVGLKALHQIGYIHQDIKPSNLLLGAGHFLKIADFDTIRPLANIPKNETFIGSYTYCSPEHILSKTVGYYSDVWAAGAFMYEAIHGRPVFGQMTSGEEKRALVQKGEIKLSPDNRNSLNNILAKALAIDVDLRYKTAQDFEADLRAYQDKSSKWYFPLYDKYYLGSTLPPYLKIGVGVTLITSTQ